LTIFPLGGLVAALASGGTSFNRVACASPRPPTSNIQQPTMLFAKIGPKFYHVWLASFVHPTRRGGMMRRDLLMLGAASVVVGLLTWALWGNPENPVPRMHTGQLMSADDNLKLVSEHSPYMRTER